MNEESKGLWHNIRAKQAKGENSLRRAEDKRKKLQKNYKDITS